MKIVVIVRIYNEQHNLPAFIDAYDWADTILIQDDWSDDDEYLYGLPKKCKVSYYTGERIERPELTRAKQHIQLNSLIRWAEHLEADWIISDDCDSLPNVALIRDGRKILESCKRQFIYTTKFHLYKDKGYFPNLSNIEGKWQHALWAWKTESYFRFKDAGDRPQNFDRPEENNILRLPIPPYVMLHRPWYDDDIIKDKQIRYTSIYGDEYKNFNPLHFGGTLKELPKWVNDIKVKSPLW